MIDSINLEILRAIQNGSMLISEVTSDLNDLTAGTIRMRVRALEKQGYIHSEIKRPPRGRLQPAGLFVVTARPFVKHLKLTSSGIDACSEEAPVPPAA